MLDTFLTRRTFRTFLRHTAAGMGLATLSHAQTARRGQRGAIQPYLPVQSRDFRLTDVSGTVVDEILA